MVDVTTAAGLILLKQNGGVLELFSRFRRGTENRGFNRFQKVVVVFQITSRFVSAEKRIWG